MDLIKKHLDVASFIVSIFAIILAGFSYFESRITDHRARKLEIYDRVKEISKDLNLEFRSDSLYFTTMTPCPEESDSEKEARLTDAAVGIRALDVLIDKEDESLVVFLKSVMLIQQQDYKEIDRLFKGVDRSYTKSLSELRVKYKSCISRDKNA